MTTANEKGEELDLGLWYPLEPDRAWEEVGNQMQRQGENHGQWLFLELPKDPAQGWCSACVRCVSQVHRDKPPVHLRAWRKPWVLMLAQAESTVWLGPPASPPVKRGPFPALLAMCSYL